MDPDSLTLIGQVANGDEQALSTLYQRHARAVFGFVLRRVANRELAQEICADVWLGCWRAAGAFRGDSQVLTWLLGIASRQVLSHTRRKRLPTVPLDQLADDVPSAAPDPAQVVATSAGMAALTAAIRQLPPDLYQVVVLAWLYDLPYPEIATAVGIPVGTVKSRVSRARRHLRQCLGPEVFGGQ